MYNNSRTSFNKLFFANKLFLSVFLLVCFAVLSFTGFIFIYAPSMGLFDFIITVLRIFPYILFVFFSFISYEFIYRIKSYKLEEVLKATPKGYGRLVLKQLLTLTLINAAFSLFIFLTFIIKFLGNAVKTTEIFAHIAQNVFLNVFSISQLAIFFGMLPGFINKRTRAYILIFAEIFLTTPMFLIFARRFDCGEKLFKLFNIFPPSLTFSPNYHFGIANLSYRYQLIAGWILLFISIFVFKAIRKKEIKTPVCPALALCACVFVSFSLFPASKFITDGSPAEDFTEPQRYYTNTLVKVKTQKPDFNIIEYNLDIKIKRLLFVTAALSIDNAYLSEYRFTLNHGYKVKSVSAPNGDALSFTREGDYLTVRNNGRSDLDKLIITYSGSAPQYYSNAQGAFLPGYFAYYPHAGYYALYDNYNGSYARKLLKNNAKFKVSVDSPKKIYCNLPEISNGIFEGETKGLTLMSGFIKSDNINGIEIVYPYTQDDLDIEKFVSQIKESGVANATKRIFLPPDVGGNSPYLSYIDFGDIIIYSNYYGGNFRIEDYETQLINSSKQYLYDIFDSYKNQKYIFDFMLERRKNRSDYENSELKKFLDAIEKLGEEQALEAVEAYIFDDSDTRTPNEFLRDLLNKNTEVN